MVGTEEPSTCRWLATCLCANYIDLSNKLMFVMGLIVVFFAFWMVFFDPISDPSLESMRGVASVSKTKWAAFIAGPLIMITACLGIQFAKNRSRGVGCGYLVCIMTALILEFFVVSIGAGGMLSDLSNINKFSGDFTVGAKTSDDYKAMVKSGKDAVYAKTFRTWAKRFNNPASKHEDYKCSYKEASETPEGDPKPSLLAAVRRLSESTSEKCQPALKTLTCEGGKIGAKFGDSVSKYCAAKSGSEKEFTTLCANCVGKWWDMWNMADHSKGTEEQIPELEQKFGGQSGAMYCRCMSSGFGFVQRHYSKIKTCGLVFGILQMVLVGSTVWLLMCGPDSKSEVDCGPIELGQQASRAAGKLHLVTCPPGSMPGSDVMVVVPGPFGEDVMMQAVVPQGIHPGMQFQVAV